jgi:photosystem II stability/assembly factor-like uncharacterized protein
MGVVELVMTRASYASCLLTGLILSFGLVAAGCGAAAHHSSRKAEPATEQRAASQSASPAARTSCRSGASSGEAASARQRPTLNAVQFVSASDGWVVGSDRVLHTGDAGRHWTDQLRTSPAQQLRAVDFTDAKHGWVVGATHLLATADGGAHWRSLPEPCPAVRAVHFVNTDDGFAVAGGAMPNPAEQPYTAGPQAGGVLLRTTDGGLHWRKVQTPPDVQTMCFTSNARGWLGASGNVYGTVNSGQSWTLAVRGPGKPGGPPDSHAIADVECAGSNAAWAELTGPGAGLGHVPQIGYHAFGSSWRPIFAQQYFPHPGARVKAEAPSVYPGPFSAVSGEQAVFFGWCPPCTSPANSSLPGPASMTVALRGGAILQHGSSVANLGQATSAAFMTTSEGWVVGIRQGTGHVSMIMHTADGGRTWQAQYTMGSG